MQLRLNQLRKTKRRMLKRSLKIVSLVSRTLLCLSWNGFIIVLDLKKALVLLEKAGKEKDFKMSASLTK